MRRDDATACIRPPFSPSPSTHTHTLSLAGATHTAWRGVRAADVWRAGDGAGGPRLPHLPAPQPRRQVSPCANASRSAACWPCCSGRLVALALCVWVIGMGGGGEGNRWVVRVCRTDPPIPCPHATTPCAYIHYNPKTAWSSSSGTTSWAAGCMRRGRSTPWPSSPRRVVVGTRGLSGCRHGTGWVGCLLLLVGASVGRKARGRWCDVTPPPPHPLLASLSCGATKTKQQTGAKRVFNMIDVLQAGAM